MRHLLSNYLTCCNAYKYTGALYKIYDLCPSVNYNDLSALNRRLICMFLNNSPDCIKDDYYYKRVNILFNDGINIDVFMSDMIERYYGVLCGSVNIKTIEEIIDEYYEEGN